MTKPTKTARNPKGAGRPLTGPERMESRTYRITEAQREKVDKLGGAKWIRKMIDEAKL